MLMSGQRTGQMCKPKQPHSSFDPTGGQRRHRELVSPRKRPQRSRFRPTRLDRERALEPGCQPNGRMSPDNGIIVTYVSSGPCNEGCRARLLRG